MRVLLAEDDLCLGAEVGESLMARGCDVVWLEDGQRAQHEALTGRFDVVVLGLNLPRRSGIDVLTAMRAQRKKAPVLVLSTRTEVSVCIKTLNRGADDYLAKPFDFDEIYARLRALCRRVHGRDGVLAIGDLCMDIDRHAVACAGRNVPMPPKEFALLRVLMSNAGRVCGRSELERTLYSQEDDVLSNAVEVHIHHLRKKIGGGRIQTVRGVGYMIERAD